MSEKDKDLPSLAHSLTGASKNPPATIEVIKQSRNQQPTPASKPKSNSGGDEK